MNGAKPLLPVYDLMAWTGTSLPLPLNEASVLTCQSVRRVVRCGQKPSRCVLTDLYNVLYTVSTQQYISKVIKHIQSGHITVTCFNRKRSSSGQ